MSNNDNPANWPQELIDRINTLERKLDDYKRHIGANQNVKDEYFIALKRLLRQKKPVVCFQGRSIRNMDRDNSSYVAKKIIR